MKAGIQNLPVFVDEFFIDKKTIVFFGIYE